MSMKMTMAEFVGLEPCPFCGGEARIFELRSGTGWRVLCSKSFCAQGPDGTTEAEAISAWNTRHVETCEPPYDELLRCLENDWHIRASWDGLRKFWCIELTEEGVKLRDAVHGTPTAEQVREAVMSVDRWEKPMSNTGLTNMHLIIRDDGWQAIADELNAERRVETCRITASATDGLCTDRPRQYFELSCGHSFTLDGLEPPNYCEVCGAKVVD